MLLLSSVSAEASGPRGHKRLLGDGRSIYAEFFSPRPSRLTRNESDYALPGSDPRIRGRRNVELDEFATFAALLQPGRVALGVSDSGPGLRGSRGRRAVRMRPRCGSPEGTPRGPVSGAASLPSVYSQRATVRASGYCARCSLTPELAPFAPSSPARPHWQAGCDQVPPQGLCMRPDLPAPPRDAESKCTKSVRSVLLVEQNLLQRPPSAILR